MYCYDFFGYNFSGRRPDGSSPLSKDGKPIHGNFFGQSSFASHSICRERNAVKVPNDVPLELLGPLACGIQTGAGGIINSLKIGMGHTLAVFGVGSVGLSAVMAARLVGAATIIAVDLHESRMKLAMELGATHAINGSRANPVEEIRKITGGAGTNFTFESTGVVSVLRQAIDALAPRGTCGFVGVTPADAEVSVNVADIMIAGRKIQGIGEGDSNPDLFIPRMIEFYKQGRFPFDRLISIYPFEEINTAIHDSENGKVVKPVVRFPQ
jgi:aryl-alcohol dehydrogenase